MGLFNFLKKRNKEINENKLSVAGNKEAVEWVQDTNFIPLAYEQYQNYYWYKGDADYLGWFYNRGVMDMGLQQIMAQRYRVNYKDYFWCGAYQEKGIKRTHSGLPRLIVDTLVNCLGIYQTKDIKEDEVNETTTKRLNEILKENNFKSTYKKQVAMDLVIGDGAYIVNVSPDYDYPIIEYIDGRNCSFEYVGDKVKAVIINKNYEWDKRLYECYERRSTKRVYDEEEKKYKVVATIEYNLFCKNGNKGWNQVALDTIPQTKDLKNLEYTNIPFMLAVPCIRKMNDETKRGDSIFKGKIELFDDLDLAISIQSNTIRASVPVEYVDSNLLEKNRDGEAISPSTYGKQVVYFRGANSYSEDPKGIFTKFYAIDFSKLSNEIIEKIKQACVGTIAPSTIGYDISKKDNAEAQREKEKATYQTVKDMQDYEQDILPRLFTMIMAVDDLITNQNAIPQETHIQVMFSDYGTPTRSERIEKYMDAYLKGAMSIDRYIQEVYFDEDKETQEKEKQALLESQVKDKLDFNFLEQE